ncbi:hypothetical protein Cgig2_032014 [Carnegiea gigantea]|uniref:Uncharacterized protein n=1 Tax=Carnegiea gigantea TaxID=171969 RepID=A0A9Q1QCT8_9CARY|nr:hypothetical protein Cgig2_032014 [Carnegiea gigantea]
MELFASNYNNIKIRTSGLSKSLEALHSWLPPGYICIADGKQEEITSIVKGMETRGEITPGESHICSVRYSGDGFCIRKWHYLSIASKGISTFKSTGCGRIGKCPQNQPQYGSYRDGSRMHIIQCSHDEMVFPGAPARSMLLAVFCFNSDLQAMLQFQYGYEQPRSENVENFVLSPSLIPEQLIANWFQIIPPGRFGSIKLRRSIQDRHGVVLLHYLNNV